MIFISAFVIVEEENVGIVTVLVVSPLNWYNVFPLNYEYSKGVPAIELQDSLILTPNLSWKVVAAAPLTKQSPFDCTKVKVVALPPIVKISPIW